MFSHALLLIVALITMAIAGTIQIDCNGIRVTDGSDTINVRSGNIGCPDPQDPNTSDWSDWNVPIICTAAIVGFLLMGCVVVELVSGCSKRR